MPTANTTFKALVHCDIWFSLLTGTHGLDKDYSVHPACTYHSTSIIFCFLPTIKPTTVTEWSGACIFRAGPVMTGRNSNRKDIDLATPATVVDLQGRIQLTLNRQSQVAARKSCQVFYLDGDRLASAGQTLCRRDTEQHCLRDQERIEAEYIAHSTAPDHRRTYPRSHVPRRPPSHTQGFDHCVVQPHSQFCHAVELNLSQRP